MERIKLIEIIKVLLLLISFVLISITSYFYLINYTNFQSQGLALIEGKEQLINSLILGGFSLGLILFGIFLMVSRRFLEILVMFLIDSLTIISGALLILGLFVPYKFNFKIALIISSFIIYFAFYIAKEFYNKYFNNK